MTSKISLTQAMSTIKQAGFNLWLSPRFAEFYVSRAIGGKMLPPNSAADIELDNEQTVEVKTSRVITHYKGNGVKLERYKWQGLHGHKGYKLGKIDHYVLVGVQEDCEEFWVIPANRVTSKTAHARPNSEQPSWLDPYYLGKDINKVRDYFRRLK